MIMRHTNDDGFTLLEGTISIGLFLMMAMLCLVNIVHARSPMVSSHSALNQAVEEARQLAMNSAGESNGALIVITAQPTGTDLLILRGRPIDGYSSPSRIPGLTPLHLDAQLMLGSTHLKSATLAFAPSGHVDLIPYPITPNWPPIANGPGCGTSDQTLDITLHTSTQSETEALDCVTGSFNQAQVTSTDEFIRTNPDGS